ncbi:MAG: hypothetical protein BYD32DRAFT_440530 [Podila humilis]|nr:MAG: hypothetical protein BYD32DRAFT_440530 [Podila humilis]
MTEHHHRIDEPLRCYISQIIVALGKTSDALPNYLGEPEGPKVRCKLDQSSKRRTSMLDQVGDEIKLHLDLAFPNYLDQAVKPEIGLKLDQFSMQWTPLLDQDGDELDRHLNLASYPNALKTIELFGATKLGKWLEYADILDKGEFGYQPDRIRQFERNSSSGDSIMSTFGSGGTPELLRKHVQPACTTADSTFASDICQNAGRVCAMLMEAGCGVLSPKSLFPMWQFPRSGFKEFSVRKVGNAVHAPCATSKLHVARLAYDMPGSICFVCRVKKISVQEWSSNYKRSICRQKQPWSLMLA